MTETEPLDIKKVMKNIKKNIFDEKKFDFKLGKKELKNYLFKLVGNREKSSHYNKTKRLLDDKHFIPKSDNSLKELDHHLHKTNTSRDIDYHQPIKSGKNKLILWAALKFRHTIQNEIRFTLDPIIRNQVEFNNNITRTLNNLVELSKNNKNLINNLKKQLQSSLDSQKQELQSSLDSQKQELQSSLDSQKQELQSSLDSQKQELQSTLNSQKQELQSTLDSQKQEQQSSLDSQKQEQQAALDSQKQELQSALDLQKQEFVRSQIRQTYFDLLKREPNPKEVENFANSILNGKLSINDMIQEIHKSKEHSTLEYEQKMENPLLIKKTNDVVEFLTEYEKQTKGKSQNALCYVDVLKISYYNKLPLTERFTEYFWVLKNLEPSGTVLDVGCSESLFAQELCKIDSLDVYGIDIREPEYPPKFSFFKEDATSTHFDDNFFDQITVISSIEHFGLEAYGNKKLDPEADHKTMQELRRILKNHGRVFVTVPFGQGKKSYYKKYDENSLRNLFDGFTIESLQFFKQTIVGWKETNSQNALMSGDSQYYPDLELPASIAVIVAKKLP